jgi:predicted transcriptional regulator
MKIKRCDYVGILYNTVKTLPELKRNHIIERLLEKGIKENKEGKSIYELDYKALRFELSIADYKEIETEKDENKWF